MIEILAATFITVIVINPSEGRGLGRDGIDYGRQERRIERHNEVIPYDSRIGRLDNEYRRHDDGYQYGHQHRYDRRYDRREHYRRDNYWGGYGNGRYISRPATGYE